MDKNRGRPLPFWRFKMKLLVRTMSPSLMMFGSPEVVFPRLRVFLLDGVLRQGSVEFVFFRMCAYVTI